MRDKLLETMSEDMGIITYPGETYECFVGRIIYSSLCQWMRYAILDEIDSENGKKSKSYILGRIKEVLSGFLEIYPECQEWIFSKQKRDVSINDLLRGLREKMLASGELVEVDKTHNVGLPAYERISCTDSYDRVVGLSKEKKNMDFVGITRIYRKELAGQVIPTYNHTSIEEYMLWLSTTSTWNECRDISAFEFFDPLSKRAPYQSWTNTLPKDKKFILSRITLYNGLHEYHIMKKTKDVYWNSPLSNLLLEWKEERRILLALRKLNGNAIGASYEKRRQVYLLKLYCGLPKKEQTLIDTFCWPMNFMDDSLNYVVPSFIWDIIKNEINNLGIILREIN